MCGERDVSGLQSEFASLAVVAAGCGPDGGHRDAGWPKGGPLIRGVNEAEGQQGLGRGREAVTQWQRKMEGTEAQLTRGCCPQVGMSGASGELGLARRVPGEVHQR